jgi:hypothetical protein
MALFLVERVISPGFNPEDADQAALHSKWATDAYNQVGATWFGSVVAGGRMYGLAAADNAEQIERYATLLGIPPDQIKIHPVDAVLGPAVAMAATDPRFRPQRR